MKQYRRSFWGLALLLSVGPVARAADPLSRNLDQSQANRLSILHDYSLDAVGQSAGQIPAEGSGLLGRFMGENDASNRAWFVSAAPVVGYDSNPDARSIAKAGAFIGVDVAAGYSMDIVSSDESVSPTHLNFALDMVSAVYEGQVNKANVIQPGVSADVSKGFFDDTVIISGRLADQFTTLHGSSFLNALDVSPALEAFWFPQFSTELQYDFAHMDYFYEPVLSSQDPDVDRSTTTFNLHFYTLPQGRNAQVGEAPDQLTEILRNLFRRATFGFGHVWSLADGTSYRYESNRILFGLEDIRPWHLKNISFDFEYAYETQRYKNFSTETGLAINHPNGFIRRADHLDVITLRGNALLANLPHNRGSLGAFFQCDIVGDNSNMTIYVLKRDTLEELGRLGRSGREAGEFHWLHQVSLDSRGNIYTAEVDTGKRLQKFVRYGEEGCSGTGRTTVGGVLR